jgi:hypothetical protein
VRVGAREGPPEEHLVRAESDAGHDRAWFERRLLDLGEEIRQVLVEGQLMQFIVSTDLLSFFQPFPPATVAAESPQFEQVPQYVTSASVAVNPLGSALGVRQGASPVAQSMSMVRPHARQMKW